LGITISIFENIEVLIFKVAEPPLQIAIKLCFIFESIKYTYSRYFSSFKTIEFIC
jgi:hypothetical protein